MSDLRATYAARLSVRRRHRRRVLGKVTFVAVADRLLVRNRKAHRTQLVRAGLIRNR